MYSVVQQANGQLITSGHSLNQQGLFTREVERVNSDGSVDSTWPGFTNEKTECLMMQTNGKVIASGYFSKVNGESRNCIARFNPDGSLDETFVANADNYVWTVAPAGPGKVLVSGGFSTIDGIPRSGVARLNLPEGTSGGVTTPPGQDSESEHGESIPVHGEFGRRLYLCTAIQSDRRWDKLDHLAVGGGHWRPDRVERWPPKRAEILPRHSSLEYEHRDLETALAARLGCCVLFRFRGAGLNAASMFDPTFNVGTGANWYVEQMLEQPDGKILICGLFNIYNGQPLFVHWTLKSRRQH